MVEKTFKKFLGSKNNSILEVEISKFQPTAELHKIKSIKLIVNL
jgi:hypothetical protein